MMINAYAYDQFDAPGLFVPNPLTPSAVALGANGVQWGGADAQPAHVPTGRLNQQTTGDMLDICASFRNVSLGAGCWLMFGFTLNPDAAVAGWYPGADAASWGVQIGVLTNTTNVYRQGAYSWGHNLTGNYVDQEVSVRMVANLHSSGYMGLIVRIIDPTLGNVEIFNGPTIITVANVVDTGLRLMASMTGPSVNSRGYKMLTAAEATIKPSGSFYLG